MTTRRLNMRVTPEAVNGRIEKPEGKSSLPDKYRPSDAYTFVPVPDVDITYGDDESPAGGRVLADSTPNLPTFNNEVSYPLNFVIQHGVYMMKMSKSAADSLRLALNRLFQTGGL